jgi:hypothetical protein
MLSHILTDEAIILAVIALIIGIILWERFRHRIISHYLEPKPEAVNLHTSPTLPTEPPGPVSWQPPVIYPSGIVVGSSQTIAPNSAGNEEIPSKPPTVAAQVNLQPDNISNPSQPTDNIPPTIV